MKLFDFISSAFRDSLTTIIIGIAAFVLVLVLTLDLAASAIALILVVSIAIFQKSFSRGWLFLLGIILLFPSVKIGSPLFNLHDILLAVLAAIGMANFVTKGNDLKFNNLSFLFFLFGLIGFSYILFGSVFGFSISAEIFLTSIAFIFYWALMTVFQFFFQTKKRLKRFFVLVISIAVAHSIFGIFSFSSGFQTHSGLGISSGAIPYLENRNIKYQANGFLGDGHVLRVGENALAPFLLVSIPLTLALFFNLKDRNKGGKTNNFRDKSIAFQTEKMQLFDSIHFPTLIPLRKIGPGDLKDGTGLWKAGRGLERIGRSSFAIFCLLILQFGALVLTFDYFSMLLCAFSIFAFGILLRKKQVITLAVAAIILLTIVFPSVGDGFALHSENDLVKWFEGFGQIKSQWIWGSGWKAVQSSGGELFSKQQQQVYNSYLYVWNTFGLFGLAAFAAILASFFRDLRRRYLESEGQSRIWLIAILVIFFEMAIFGLSANAMLFGPSAVVFWLLYPASSNLAKKKAVFGLTETRL